VLVAGVAVGDQPPGERGRDSGRDGGLAAAGFSSGTLINAATVAGAALLLVYSQEIIKLTASARHGLSRSQLRDIRDKAYQNTLDALNRTLTQAEQDELTVVLSRLGI
jgi:hypothetical protein